MDFIDPEGFLIESVKAECKANKKTEDDQEGLALFWFVTEERSKIQDITP